MYLTLTLLGNVGYETPSYEKVMVRNVWHPISARAPPLDRFPLPVCLLPASCKNYWWDLYENFTRCQPHPYSALGIFWRLLPHCETGYFPVVWPRWSFALPDCSCVRSANTFRSYFRSSSRKISLLIWMAVAWNKQTDWQIDRVTDATGHQSIASFRSITRWCSLVHQTIWRRASSSPIPVIGSAANARRHLYDVRVCI